MNIEDVFSDFPTIYSERLILRKLRCPKTATVKSKDNHNTNLMF